MMQQGQSAHRQAHLADQAARQAQLQVRLGHQQAEQGRYRRRQQQAGLSLYAWAGRPCWREGAA